MAALKHQKSIESIDALIKEGKGLRARQQLRHLMGEKITREERQPIAALARRLTLYKHGANLLNPIVRPVGKTNFIPTPAEIAEYAACLTSLGASEEAFALLSKLEFATTPQAALFMSFGLFSQWNYHDAIPLLEKYIKHSTLTPYQVLVGKVNLAAAYVYERKTEKAGEVLEQILLECDKHKLSLLKGNTLELLSQNYIFSQNLKRAQATLAKAKQSLAEAGSLDTFFVDKWAKILNFIQTGKTRCLREIRSLALQKKHWETVRDCDRFLVLHTADEDTFLHLYFGSPYPSFRERLLADFNSKIEIPSSYVLKLCSTGSIGHTLNLISAKLEGSELKLKPGQSLHRLLLGLSIDFYRPMRIAVLHHLLFPDEYYHPIHSAHKIHEKIRLLRIWFKEQKLPLIINQKEGYFSLSSRAPFSLRIEADSLFLKGLEVRLDQFSLECGSNLFTRKEMVEALGISNRSANRIIQQWTTIKRVKKIGAGPTCSYQFSHKK